MGTTLTCCSKDSELEESHQLINKEIDNASYTDIASDPDEIKEEEQKYDIQPSDHIYDFDPNMMNRSLLYGLSRKPDMKIPLEVVKLMTPSLNQLICLYIPVFDTEKVLRITYANEIYTCQLACVCS